jgi:hypothetical protein
MCVVAKNSSRNADESNNTYVNSTVYAYEQPMWYVLQVE